MDTGLEEVVPAYKAELGLSDKEAAQLEHLQVSHASPRLAHDLSRMQCIVTIKICCHFCQHTIDFVMEVTMVEKFPSMG